ncbi:MAG TPA: hypothetical protein VE173_05110, partial [Longimicrobiales bacterium]|nr:hypothetical protein [Longimicrobiales bacterium]
GGDGNDVVLAFYNPLEDVLSVHATSDDFACGTQTTLRLKPLSDRLVAEPIEEEHLNQMGPVFTQVYSGVTPTGLEDFVADHCLYLDTASPLATGTADLHFTAMDATSYDTSPYTLRITGSLLDGSGGGEVHLIVVRQYLITSSGARAAYPLKWVGPSLSSAR